MSALQDLQRSMKLGKASGFQVSRILPDYVSEDIYGTLTLASNSDPSNEKYHIVDANDLLVEGIEATIQRGYEFFQLAGLALKQGASSNLYVTVRYLDEQGDDQMTVLHVLAYAWKVYMEKGEDYRYLLAIVSLLCAAGSDARMPVTDRKILLERKRRDAKDPSCVSAAEVISTSGTPKSVLNLIAQSTELPEILDRRLEDRSETYLSTQILKYIAVFTAFKGTLADVRKIISSGSNRGSDRLFTASDLDLSVPIDEDDHEIAMDLATQIGEFLDDPSHMSGSEGVEKLKSCMNLHANRCAEVLLASKMITIGEAEEVFFEAVQAYNGKGVKLMIDNAFVPKYNHMDRILFIALKKKGEALPISAEIMLGILVMLCETGASLDNQQMRIAGIISEETFSKLSEIQLEPYWQRTCSTPGQYIRQDMRQLARTLDLNPELDKKTLCAKFTELSSSGKSPTRSGRTPVKGGSTPLIKGGQSTARNASKTPRRTVKTKTSRTVIEEQDEDQEEIEYGIKSLGNETRSRSTSSPSSKSCNRYDDLEPEENAVCVNASQLTRDPSTYAKLDLHRIRDQSNGLTYCFESVDYPTLLRTKTNEYTNSKLTTLDLAAINAKYRTLMDLGLPLESESIEDGIKRLRGAGTHQDYELFVRSKRDGFLALLNDPEIAISTELFTNEPVDGGLEIEEMQEIINHIGRSEVVAMTPLDNREHALRTFAMTFMEYIEEIHCKHYGFVEKMSDSECHDQLHLLFENLIEEVETVASSKKR